MRVAPWKHYQLVDNITDTDFQLASEKNRLVRRCASFVCLGGATAGLQSPSNLKVGPAQNQENLKGLPVFDLGRDFPRCDGYGVNDDKGRMHYLKSNLKKPDFSFPVAAPSSGNCTKEHKAMREKNNNVGCRLERRKVQWTDTLGGELFQIREFEMSEDGQDNEFGRGNQKTCSCCIM